MSQRFIGYTYKDPTNTWNSVSGVGGTGQTMQGRDYTNIAFFPFNNATATGITGANGVNNEFGAGESSTIRGNNYCLPGFVVQPSGMTSPVYSNPATAISARGVSTTPNTIRLGSSTSSGQNIVINSYNKSS